MLKGNCSPALGLQKAPSFVSVSDMVADLGNGTGHGLGQRAELPLARAQARTPYGRRRRRRTPRPVWRCERPSPSTHETSFCTRDILRPLFFAHGRRDSRLSRFENTSGSLCEYKGLLGASARRANQFCVWSGRQSCRLGGRRAPHREADYNWEVLPLRGKREGDQSVQTIACM